jgi:hypothetical protein
MHFARLLGLLAFVPGLRIELVDEGAPDAVRLHAKQSTQPGRQTSTARRWFSI